MLNFMGHILLALERSRVSRHVWRMNAAAATASLETPIGPVLLAADDRHLLGVRIGRSASNTTTQHPVLREALAQMADWFAGRRTAFSLPLAPLDSEEGARLRAGIASIPYGETLTYGRLGERLGSVARAVGQACKTNPYPIIIPCHRVVSTSGPEYYSGGNGPRTKSWLIDFEYDHLPLEKRTRLI
jgi:methylated-DNA-[protein]-cysteine S-methyltransferase